MNTQSMGLAVITGASSGIGAVYADRLARRGYDLLLVARNQERMDESGRETCRGHGQQNRGPDRRSDKFETMWPGWSNSAGDSTGHPAREQRGRGRYCAITEFGRRRHEPDDRAQCGGADTADLRRSAAFVKRGAGAIINIASVVAVAPELLNGVYGGTKAFVLGFSQSLRHELANTGVKVQVVLPGATATNFWSIAGRPVEQSAAGNRDVRRGYGGRGSRGLRSRGVRHHPRAPGCRAMAVL